MSDSPDKISENEPVYSSNHLINFLFSSLADGLRRLPKNMTRSWPTMLIMLILWLFPVVLTHFRGSTGFLGPLYFITGGSNGTYEPGVSEFIGGTLAKAIILAGYISVILKLVHKKAPLSLKFISGFFKNYSSVLTNGISGFGAAISGLGAAFIIHAFISTDGSFLKSFASFICMVYAMKSVAFKTTFLKGITESLFPRKESIGNPFCVGMASGFLSSFIVTSFVRSVSSFYFTGLIFLFSGLILVSAGRIHNKTVISVFDPFFIPLILASNNISQTLSISSFIKDLNDMNIIIPGISAIIAIFIGGILASASNAEAQSDSVNEKLRDFKMEVVSSSGNKIKCGQSVTLSATIYERILENDGTVSNKEKPEATSRISITASEKYVKFLEPSILGGKKTISFIIDPQSQNDLKGSEFSIIFSSNGPTKPIQKEVTFRIAGAPEIRLPDESLYIKAESGTASEFQFEFVDFLEKITKIEVSAIDSAAPFTIRTGRNKSGVPIIIVRVTSAKKIFEDFHETFNCKIHAENKNESAQTEFSVVLCHEGILPDFLGKQKEIRAFRNDINNKDMSATLFYVRAGLWNHETKKLDLQAPDETEIIFSDSSGIFEIIGTSLDINPEKTTRNSIAYTVKAKKCFPSDSPIDAKMLIRGSSNGLYFKNEIRIKLIPDHLQFGMTAEDEFHECKYIIETYMSERYRSSKLRELDKFQKSLAFNDLKLFHEKCWQTAQRSVLEYLQDYTLDEAWSNCPIATQPLIVYIGDIAFDIVLSPISGPISGFFEGQVKYRILELFDLYSDNFERSEKSLWALTTEYINALLLESSVSTSGTIEVPDSKNPDSLSNWLVSFALYRISYRWNFDKDINAFSIGISDSIKRGILDLIGENAESHLTDFVKIIEKDNWASRLTPYMADELSAKAATALLNFISNMNYSNETMPGDD